MIAFYESTRNSCMTFSSALFEKSLDEPLKLQKMVFGWTRHWAGQWKTCFCVGGEQCLQCNVHEL